MSAYPSFEDLEMLMNFEFDIELIEHVSDKANLKKVTFELLKWAKANDKTHELIEKANRDNHLIQKFYNKIMQNPK